MRIYFTLTAILTVVSLTVPFISCTANKKQVTSATSEISTSTEADNEEKISVLNLSSGETFETDINEYIIGVVAGEMPASFSPEALKAQAVAAYTYVKYTKETDNSNETFTITDSSSLHQSYIDTDEQKKKWGEDYELYRSRIESAVKSTQGEFVSYNGKAALTAFHADSYKSTRSAEEIWGNPVAYLISAEAPSDEEFIGNYTFTPDEFKTRFKERGAIDLTEKDIKKWASITQKSEKGYIRSLKVGEKEFSAIEIKDILSLPSTSFTGKIENDTFVFTVKGKGHGVGMSQYSAEYMAKNGKTYKDILAHFYPGTTLEKE